MGNFTEPGGARDGYEHRLPDTETKRAELLKQQQVEAAREEVRAKQFSVYRPFPDWVTIIGMLDRAAGTDVELRRIVDDVQVQVSSMRPDKGHPRG